MFRDDKMGKADLVSGEYLFCGLNAFEPGQAHEPHAHCDRDKSYLVLEGRGFGHGCGLSQVSAWHLAKKGETPEQIVARFYAGARIERRYE